MNLIVNGFVGPVKMKKFLMFGAWWRVESDDYLTVNKISETFASMGFRVEIRKLHI